MFFFHARSLLKDFLRKLRYALIPAEQYEKCVAVGQEALAHERQGGVAGDFKMINKHIDEILSKTPAVNQAVLRMLVGRVFIFFRLQCTAVKKSTFLQTLFLSTGDFLHLKTVLCLNVLYQPHPNQM